MLVGVARVGEAVPHRTAAAGAKIGDAPLVERRRNHVVGVELVGIARLVAGNHHLVQLLAGTDADDVEAALGRHRLRQIDHFHARNLGHEDLAAVHPADRRQHQRHALIERDPEARHVRVGDRQHTAGALRREERNHAAAAADDVPVADAGEPRAGTATVRVGRDEQFVGAQLRRAVEVDRVGGLVGAERDDAPDAGVERDVDDVLRADDVGLHDLERVVLRRRHLLQGGGVNDHVDVLKRAVQPIAIADVAEEEAQPRVVAELLGHLRLLHLVAAQDDQLLRVRVLEDDLGEAFPERAGAAGDQNGLAVKAARRNVVGVQGAAVRASNRFRIRQRSYH